MDNSDMKYDKMYRVLQIYSKLSDGYVVNKAEEAQNYGVDKRSIQRDIDDIRNFLDMDVDAILDRLPTAVIQDEDNGVYAISAEVFGKGIDMWLRSQGNLIEVL